MLRLQNTPLRRFAGEHRGPPCGAGGLQRTATHLQRTPGRRRNATTAATVGGKAAQETLRDAGRDAPPGGLRGREVVGELGLGVSTNPRTRHTGNIGMAVHDDWQGKGIGTALMEAALDLADNWLNLTRIELRVYVDNAPAVAFQSTKTPPVRFRALIDGVGAARLELARA